MTNKKFEFFGNWWANKNIEMVKIEGKVYALHGWNGESYCDCWECTDKYYMSIGKENIIITPIYEEVEDDFEIVGYKLN